MILPSCLQARNNLSRLPLLILCAASGWGSYSRRIPSRVMVALPRFKALACLAPFCQCQVATQDGFPVGSRSRLLAPPALPSWIRGLCCITLLCHCAGMVCGLCLLVWNNVVDCLGIRCRDGEAVHAGGMHFTITISRGGCTHSIKHPSVLSVLPNGPLMHTPIVILFGGLCFSAGHADLY